MANAAQHFEAAATWRALGDRMAALHHFQRGLLIDPSNGSAWANRAIILYTGGNPFDALISFDRAIDLSPGTPELYTNRAACYIALGCHEEAERDIDKALEMNPSHFLALSNKGNMRYLLGDYDTAAKLYTKAMKADATDDLINEAQVYRGFAYLAQGKLKQGFKDYEKRLNKKNIPSRIGSDRRWDGKPCDAIMVVCEQGFGDTLQFMRYAPMLKQRANKVYLEVRPQLLRLAKTMPGIDGVVVFGEEWPKVDAAVAEMSLPYHLHTDTLDDIPWPGPYLHANPAPWHERLQSCAGERIGLCWAGQARVDVRSNEVDARRSMSLLQMAPLAKQEGINFISLQWGDEAHQRAPAGMKLLTFANEIDDFYDTAALIRALDLVITVDTSVAHVAGALGKPVWLLSRFDNCWRWFGDRKDLPWYPSLRQFRQSKWGDWQPVMMEVAQALSERVALQQAA